ncbi:NUDIX domain-containing protein [Streptomyces chrestomyceticus]|uniref:NUDIX domain-containing protein n=1 Tax=Streptomyces chrestomyceticus TaxID=68185 RepID=UPI0033C4FECC
METGETPHEAVTREPREETGLVLPGLRSLTTVHQGNGRADIRVFAASWHGAAARIRTTSTCRPPPLPLAGHSQRAVCSSCAAWRRPCSAGPGWAVTAMVAARPSSVAAESVA